MSDWLELELAHHLSATKAPDDLWEALQNSHSAPRRIQRPKWPIAAIVTLMVAMGAMWMVAKGQHPARDLRELAKQQLYSPLDLHSSDPGEIAAWARAQTGVDFSLKPAPSAELLGARLIYDRGECIAAVSYRINGKKAALLVARASFPGSSAHGAMSWQKHGQSYALATEAAHADAACLICHL